MQQRSAATICCRPEKQQAVAALLEAVAQQGCALAGLLSGQAGLLQRQEAGLDPENALRELFAADPRAALSGVKGFIRETMVRRTITAVCRLEILQQMKLELFAPGSDPLPPCAAVREEQQLRRLLSSGG